MVIQNYLNFENSSFVVHFTLDQTGVLFLGNPVDDMEQNHVSEWYHLSVAKQWVIEGPVCDFTRFCHINYQHIQYTI